MRGIVELITGVFAIAAVALVAGVILEPITGVVISSEAVKSLGWDSIALNIRDNILRWAMLIGILFFVVWATMWAIRRERTTEVRR